MKVYIFILSAIFLWHSGSCQDFINASKNIENCGKSNKSKWHGETFHDLRMKLRHQNKLGFVDFSDSLFLLESYNVESGIYTGMIWNKKGELNYKYSNGSFELTSQSNFSPHVIQLIRNWDANSIENESRQSNNQLHEVWIKGVVVVKLKRNLKVRCISFKSK